MFSELECEISESELLKSVKQLKNNTSEGPDLLLNEFFKYGILHLKAYFLRMFIKYLKLGYFPKL